VDKETAHAPRLLFFGKTNLPPFLGTWFTVRDGKTGAEAVNARHLTGTLVAKDTLGAN